MRLFPAGILHIFAAALAFGVAGVVAAADGDSPSSPEASSRDIRPPNALLNLNVHVYGFSYHTDRAGVRRRGLNNELNVGLGLNYTLHEDERGISFVEAGAYRDSGSNEAKLVGVGYQFKYGERWSLGGALMGIQSPTYNHGRFFVAPLPMLTYELGAVKLNALYVPKYSKYNAFAVFGFYFSLPLLN